MTTLATLSGTYTLDPTHTEIGFVARHAMVTKVRGAFTEFLGTATTAENLTGAQIDLSIQAASVSTNNADRDGHLRSADFFDVETYPTIRFVSTHVTSPSPEVLRVEGDLTIKNVTRPVAIDFAFEGAAVDPFGNERVGLSGEVVVNRRDFDLTWNAALETGGVLVSENVTLTFEVSAVRTVEQADAPAEAAEDVAVGVEDGAVSVEDATIAEPVAESRVEEPRGIIGWLKRVLVPASR